ncbi:hypothetical protein ONS95_010511 [Cadophora gregata]|uniref:uncharacterized protein n=1 Tax=Cadophora gregata TaxID=51156 RepID=UPI0026DD3DF3|nr:uncharacterized protein ONS95_010511 [Cadophora gregata]KAK0122261.1 hypothetical protein ONS95_010511 [Cadophora gregata]KAK0127736.1 hypothetical protein ONS96_007250 [Cadophora gregata f. sp. sojae]
MNHTNFEQRLDFIRTTIQQQYGLSTVAIDPIEYDPQCMFPYNNFVYRVKLSRSTFPSSQRRTVLDAPAAQPGTVAIPDSAQHVVMRLSNAAAGLNDQNRVQNEVAAMSLARKALAPRQIVPTVYGWASAAKDQGWILMEHMRGTPLDANFEDMSSDDKNKTLKEVADIVRAMQQYELPESIQGFGGLDFGSDGNIVSGPLTVFPCGPFTTYSMLVKGVLYEQLAAADKSPIIRGWTTKDTRAKLERFITKNVDRMLQGINTEKKRLVHGDFTMNNFLFDKEAGQITAILDFDWAQIGLAADEILRSFHKCYARFPGPYEQDPDRVSLRHALLHGFPSPLPISSRSVRWDIAEMWDSQLADVDAERPSTLEGIEPLSRLYTLLDMICPDMLSNEVIIKQRSRKTMEREKEVAEEVLERFLKENQA